MNEPLNENQNDAETENDIKKIKLSLEHGVDFAQSSVSPDLTAEIEGQFLDYIQNWEEQFARRKMTTVYEMAGKPTFMPISEIPGDEISTALENALKRLDKYSIRLDTLCDVSDYELYRFITEELLQVEINDIHIEGMLHCFTYEEFHPNHPYDIKNRCTEVFNHIASVETEEKIIPWGLDDQISCGGQVYNKEDLNKHMIRFRQSFAELNFIDVSYKSVTLNTEENEATAVAVAHFLGTTTDNQPLELNDECEFHLRCEYGWWVINQLETPWGITT
jgi:hypothetical protein